MPYEPTLWVANSTPRISASRLNKIEQGIVTAQATAESALSSGGGGGSTSIPGIVQVDSFSGSSDAAKMTAALSYAAAQTYTPWIQLPARTFNTGSSTFNVFTGMKILGAGVSFGPQNLEISNGKGVEGKWQTSCGNGASSLLQATSTVYDWAVSGVAFHGGSSSQIFRSTSNAYACAFENLTFYGCKHAFGNPSEKFLMTQVVFSGHWTNLSFPDTQYTLGGSDNLLDWFLNMNSPASISGGGKPMMILDNFSKSDVHYNYLTCENDWGGIQYKGTQDDRTNFFGGTYEGRGASNLATRPVIDVQSGTAVFHAPHVGYVSGSSGNVNGAIHQSGGILILNNPIYLRGNGVAASFPLLYQTGGVARIKDPICGTSGEQVRIRWSSGTTETVDALTNALV